MTITKLSAELRSGALEAQISLETTEGTDLVAKLIEALNTNLQLRKSGTEIEGKIRKTDGDNSVCVTFAEGWLVEDAEALLHSLERIRRTLRTGSHTANSVQATIVRESLPDSAPRSRGGVTLNSLEKTVASVDRSGWISDLKSHGSRLSQLLAHHGIETDKQYIELESGLPTTQRISLAQARFEYGLGKAHNPDLPGKVDLQVLSVFAPAWVDAIPMHVNGFPRRGRNCLNAVGIERFSQLAELRLESLLSIPNFGRLTYEQIANALVDRLMVHAIASLNAEPLRRQFSESMPARDNHDFSSFTAVWDALTALVDNKSDIEVLTRRIGFGTDAGPETLEMVGKPMDVCRERVRQIQKRAVDRLHQSSRFCLIKASIEAEIGRQIAWKKAPVTLGDECTLHTLKGASFETIKAFLQLILRSDFKVLIANSADGTRTGRILPGLGEGELKDALRQLEEFITANDEEPRSRFMPLVQAFIQNTFDESIHSDLKAFVEEWVNWDYSGDPKIISFGDSIEAAAAAVLQRSTRALKLPELIEIAQNDFGLDQTERSIRNVLNNLCRYPGKRSRKGVRIGVFQVGPSEFGTKRHLPFDPAELGHLIPLLTEIIVNGRQSLIADQPYQWHTNCLWKELKKRYPDNELAGFSRADGWRAVDWLLRYHAPSGVVNLNKSRWVKEIVGENQEARTNDQAIIWLLTKYFRSSRAPRKEVESRLVEVQSPALIWPAPGARSGLGRNASEYWLVDQGEAQ